MTDFTEDKKKALGHLRGVWQQFHDGELTSFAFVATNAKGDVVPVFHIETAAELLNLIGAISITEADMIDSLRAHLRSMQPLKTAPAVVGPGGQDAG